MYFQIFDQFDFALIHHVHCILIKVKTCIQRYIFVPRKLVIFRNPYNAYYKVLVGNAATSALRLHQRLPPVSINREFLSLLFQEDSCHYLFYSLIFLYVAPVTCILSCANISQAVSPLSVLGKTLLKLISTQMSQVHFCKVKGVQLSPW